MRTAFVENVRRLPPKLGLAEWKSVQEDVELKGEAALMKVAEAEILLMERTDEATHAAQARAHAFARVLAGHRGQPPRGQPA